MKKKVYWLVGVVLFLSAGMVGAKFALDSARTNAARFKVQTLTGAVKAYAVANGKFPDALEELFVPDPQGQGPYMSGDLSNSWGEIKYDVAGKKHNGELPDIWVVTPDDEKIGNW